MRNFGQKEGEGRELEMPCWKYKAPQTHTGYVEI
jgi:hypothetical protein